METQDVSEHDKEVAVTLSPVSPASVASSNMLFNFDQEYNPFFANEVDFGKYTQSLSIILTVIHI